MRKLFILLAASMLCFACKSGTSDTNSSETSSDLSIETPAKLVAERVLIGDLYYDLYDNNTAEVVIREEGYYSKKYECKGELFIPSSVAYNSSTYTVTSIGDAAFAKCKSITSVIIPNSVTNIGYAAFQECENLKSVTIPNSVSCIGDWVFAFCENLDSITIPNSVTSIGYCTFAFCENLSEPVYNAHIFAYLPKSYSGAYAIPEGIKLIAYGAFGECTKLTSVTIPNSVTSIGDAAFCNCHALKTIVIPNSVNRIGNEVFKRCFSLTTVTIPNSVTFIGEWAFMGCESLTSITIPNSVKGIVQNAFEGCSPELQIIFEE